MTNAIRHVLKRAAALVLVTGTALGASAQLNEKCTVSILNRNAQAASDGSWIAPTVPANFGPVRARATCVENGVTKSGESELFTVGANTSTDVPPIVLGATTPIPTLLTLTSPLTTLSAEGASAQINVVATMPDGSTVNVTTSTGTSFTISNNAIATITASGRVTALSSGTAVVQASHEGTSGLLAVNVVLSADTDGDGILDDIELREGLDPNNPTDAFEDFDRDGLSNLGEVRAGTLLRNRDSDGDTILDGEEAEAGTDGFVTSPLQADTDGDGLRDALEVETGSDPTNATSYNLAAALTGITATPPAFTLISNVLQPEAYTQLNVVGRLRDGFDINLTSNNRGTNYSSSNVQVCNFGAVPGRVYAGVEGSCTVTVLNNGHSASVIGQVRNFTPRALARLDIPGFANGVDVADGHAYIAAGSTGLQVADVSNPSAPRIVAARDTNGNANDVRVVGRYAYVADGGAGLKIIDVVNPAAPVIVGSVDTPGDATHVAISGNVAYISDGFSGLTVVNVASPSAPILVATLDTPGFARGIDVLGNYAFIADHGSGIRVVNISNPAAPVNAGFASLSGELYDIRVVGNYAYVAAYTGGLHIVNVTNPAAPVRVGTAPSSGTNGQMPFDVEIAERLALVADVLFVNAVPAIDITNPASPVLRGSVNFSQFSDYDGTGIAIAGPYVFMTGSRGIADNASSGTTALFIGQFLPLEDLAGVAPEVRITSPATNEPQYEGTNVTVTATATDDVAVSMVTFSVNGQLMFTDSSAPYEYTLDIPTGVSAVTLTATGVDLASNIGSDTITIPVVPDPLTTVSGIVVDEAGAPLVGATVVTQGDRTATTGAGGAFSIYGAATVRGPIVASASYTRNDGTVLSGSSAPVEPVRGGTTNAGTITAVSAIFETNYGQLVSRSDDDYYLFNLPFQFPFFNTTQTQAYVGTNGYITFGSGDWTYTETLPRFSSLPRISAFFDDLYGRSTGAMYVNTQLPGRFVVTYDKVQHFSWGGSNTIQITLYADGRILFAYRGITALNTGAITGITPGPGSPFEQVDFSTRTNFDVAPGTAIYEYFTSTNLFDLDYSYVLFTHRGDGSYNVRTVLPAPSAARVNVSGGPETGTTATLTTATNSAFGKSEVEVLSSGDVTWRGHTNTDNNGKFSIENVPAGAVVVTVTKKGKVVGQGSAVVRGNSEAKIKIEHQKPDKPENNEQ